MDIMELIEEAREQYAREERLWEAVELLEKIYLEVGPYRTGKIEDKTWSAVRATFGFDDSE